MSKVMITVKNNNIEVNKGLNCYEIMKKYNLEGKVPVVMVRINGKLSELSKCIEEDSVLEYIDISTKLGMMCYMRTLQFVLIKATTELFNNSKITIEHSLSKGLFGEIHKKPKLGIDDIYSIKENMRDVIEHDIRITKKIYDRKEAIELFRQKEMFDKVKLLEFVSQESVTIYELDGTIDYFYGPMAYSTGVLKYFDLIYYEPGFILRFPTIENPTEIPRFEEHKKLAKIFYEAEEWGNILDVGDVGSLNEVITNGDIVSLIRIAEALHEKKIAYVADKIHEKKTVKLVLIAGPSSSGKTTFSKRLGIQLRVNGLIPIPISLDDYFVNRNDTPKDEFGELDFESIYALDFALFNKHLEILLSGGETELPTYNFRTGEREWNGHMMKLPENGVLIVEGIHGLNEMLTSSISHDEKFKIYISPLTQINLDDHNRIATTDVRMIRRIVRDYLSRGYGVEDTLKMWPSIRRGEDKNIFVFQEDADAMFNSAVIYELAVLKKYALTELYKIQPNSPVYDEARRLINFLHFFKEVDKDFVPTNSLVREFIGGSCFYQY
ncbi:nucleoside kinase [Clostridium sp.]|uniref:nucleoside kinase n=1 Tax=Clostridium sp. TaxID=1506 RepID=UPI002FC9ECC4